MLDTAAESLQIALIVSEGDGTGVFNLPIVDLRGGRDGTASGLLVEYILRD